MNYLWEAFALPNTLAAEKNVAIVNEKQNIFLVSPKPINLNEATATVKIIKPNQDKSEAQSQSLLAFTNAQIKLLSHQAMVLSFDSAISSTMTLQLEPYTVVGTDIRKLQVSFASNKEMVIENTRFLELNFRGKSIKARSFNETENKNNEFFKEPAEKA